jgi:hypothetical protein
MKIRAHEDTVHSKSRMRNILARHTFISYTLTINQSYRIR